MIRDFNIEWLEKRVFIPAWTFQTFAIVGPSGGATDTGGAQGAGAGNPVMTEIGTTGIVGGEIAAAGDKFATIWMPGDLDITKQLRARVWWTQTSTTATDTVDWLVTYTPLVAETTVLVDPVTALSTAITLADASSGVANTVQATSFGVINRNTVANTTDLISLGVEADGIGTFSANEVLFLGLELRYTPRKTAGPRRNVLGGRRLNTTYPLGVQLASTQEGL